MPLAVALFRLPFASLFFHLPLAVTAMEGISNSTKLHGEEVSASAYDDPNLEHLKLILGIIGQAVGVALALVILYFVCRRLLLTNNSNGPEAPAENNTEMDMMEMPRAIEYAVEAGQAMQENQLDMV